MSQTTRRLGYQSALTMPAPVILENNPQAPAATAAALASASALTFIADDAANVKAYALTAIPDDWQQDNALLTALFIGSGVTSIGALAFYGCTGLSGPLTIPAGVTSIGSGAFASCVGLSGPLTIPAGVMSIGADTFSNCGLSGPLTIPSSVTNIGESAIRYTTGIVLANIYTTKTVMDEYSSLYGSNIQTIHARASDATWDAGAGQTIGGQTLITVIKDL